MTGNPNASIPEGAAVSWTDDEGGEWPAVVVQQLPGDRYDVRLTDTHTKVLAHRSELSPW